MIYQIEYEGNYKRFKFQPQVTKEQAKHYLNKMAIPEFAEKFSVPKSYIKVTELLTF